MIVEFDGVGRITHIIKDPVPPQMADFLREEGRQFLELPPIPREPQPQFDADGSPLMEPVLGEDGQPLMEIATDGNGLPLMEDVTDPATGHLGRRAVMRPVTRQVYASNGVDYAVVDILRDYVVGGKVAPRPYCPASVKVDGRRIAISGVPEGGEVLLDLEGELFPLDGDCDVEIDEPGPVTVTITCPWPYLESRHDLEVE